MASYGIDNWHSLKHSIRNVASFLEVMAVPSVYLLIRSHEVGNAVDCVEMQSLSQTESLVSDQ